MTVDAVLGVVLAGGRSTRMGRDKAAIEIDGMTLLERAASTMSEVFGDVAVAGGSASPPGYLLLEDTVPGGGPLAGLDAAYSVAAGRSVFLLAVDMPLIDAATIRSIAEPGVPGDGARVPVVDGRSQPLCALYGSGLGPLVIEHLESSDRSMARFVSGLNCADYFSEDASVFANVNTAEDLERLLR